MELGKNKRSYGVTVAIIATDYFDEIRSNLCSGSMETYNRIAEIADRFETKHKDTVWEDHESDYESVLDGFVAEEIENMRGMYTGSILASDSSSYGSVESTVDD